MNQKSYPAPQVEAKITADVVLFTIVDNQLQLLAIERAREPYKGSLALPGGFVWEGETSQQTAERILATKAGVRGVFVEQLYTFDDVERDTRGRVISVGYYALVAPDALDMTPSVDTEQPRLLRLRDAGKLAFDHPEIVGLAVRRLRNKVNYSNAMYALLPDLFTFSQLHAAYEAVLGMSLDKRNFRKKFLSLGLLTATSEKTAGGRHRPAQLYRFTEHKFLEMNRWL